MTFTSHGHYIPGTPATNDPPENRARCGGVKICKKCNEEAVTVLEAQLKKLREETESNKAMLTAEMVGIPFSTEDEGVDYPLIAKKAVQYQWNVQGIGTPRGDRIVPLELNELYVVWFSYVLGNWKAILSSSRPNGRIWEVTCKKRNGVEFVFVDSYLKTHQTELDTILFS